MSTTEEIDRREACFGDLALGVEEQNFGGGGWCSRGQPRRMRP